MKTLIVKKPWGQFEQFTHNEKTTVKIISINHGGSLSLQTHDHRTEFWQVISGHPIVTIGDKKINANPGDEFTVEKLQPHRLEAAGDDVKILEIAFGDFDEDDIIRIEDKYGRA
ncbi:MAG: phosphomannose isomerase type II C-terminal cupin domain [Patescibacteria group bacterium]